jgi:hypothetical protein
MNPHPFSHYFKPIDVQHLMEALTTLSNIGMIIVLSDNADSRQIYSWEPLPAYKEFLEAKRHVPPCYATDAPYSLSNAPLFFMLFCTMNLQYCTSYLILRYLAKFVGSLDKASKIVINSRGRPDAENTLKVHEENANNTKITGNLVRERRLASMKKIRTSNWSERICLCRRFSCSSFVTPPVSSRPIVMNSVLPNPWLRDQLLKRNLLFTS